MKLEIKNLSKNYGQIKALSDINVTFNPGIYGILGPNGAGKSTLMNLIADNITRESGVITYDGIDIVKMGKEFRGKLGYMPQEQGFFDDMSARNFLLYISKLKNIPADVAKNQIDDMLEIVNLEDVQYKKISSYSGGMKQRVLLAQAMIGNPEVLILDEPTAGLDPNERIKIRNYIAKLAYNKIILFATHVVSDVECIANEIMILKNGRIAKMDKPATLIESLNGRVAEINCNFADLDELKEKYHTGNIGRRKSGLVLRLVGNEFPDDAKMVYEDIGLEDVFLYYISNFN